MSPTGPRNISPLIPGLTDHEPPEIMNEVTKRGGKWAGFKMLRLPGMVAPLFLDWLHRTLPDQAEKSYVKYKKFAEVGLTTHISAAV